MYFDKNEVAHSTFRKRSTDNGFLCDETSLAETADIFRKTSNKHHAARVHIEFSTVLTSSYHLQISGRQAICLALNRICVKSCAIWLA